MFFWYLGSRGKIWFNPQMSIWILLQVQYPCVCSLALYHSRQQISSLSVWYCWYAHDSDGYCRCKLQFHYDLFILVPPALFTTFHSNASLWCGHLVQSPINHHRFRMEEKWGLLRMLKGLYSCIYCDPFPPLPPSLGAVGERRLHAGFVYLIIFLS